jgi:ubiquinone/menaquinone biosynthesis C-methylase UbiE
VSSAEDRRRATIFGTVAGEYELARPDYPAEAVSWLGDQLGIGPGRDVLDLGAGTGKLTRQLAALGANVVAVEPDGEMRVELERGTPGVEALAGSAESIPLRDSTVDAITCAQAFHWFDVDRALPEMWRVLRPAGGIGLIWNLRDETDSFQEGLSAIVGETDRNWNVETFFLEAAARDGLFGEGSRMSCSHEQLLPRAQLADRVASMSSVAVLGDVDRARVYSSVQAYAETVPEPIRLAYVTEAYVFRRLD